MQPNPPPEPAPFQEVPVKHAADKKLSVVGFGLVLFAGACAFLYIVGAPQTNLFRFYDGTPPKWFVGLSAVQVVLFFVGVSAAIRRRERDAIRWAAVLIGATVISYLLTLFLSGREMR